jgi:excisionase family DNA binding protein
MEKLLTAKEVASGLGIHVETLYLWVKQNRFSFVPIGRKIMFRPAAVQEYLDKLEVPA